jgi:Gas vesicle protein
MSNQIEFGRTRSTGLVEVLDRVLDKGLFVGGDIKISLAEVELLTIRIRLIVCSLDKAREIGLDWWMYDRHLSPGRSAIVERDQLEQRIVALERQLGAANEPRVVVGPRIEVRAPVTGSPKKGAPRARAKPGKERR